ncbi:MAG TPA: response regulator transcription factor [Burkholderiales bacterium]|jgi:DNA-binding NarL/FixJ family response regulator|nr:response regulator transcription factor [Burkholderiales bacterium]
MQKVFLVEDSSLVLERLIALLGALPNTQIVGHAAGAEESVRAILATRPDVVVLDFKLAQGTGFDVLIELHDKEPGIDLYMLSNYCSEAYRRQAERLGARGFFDKTTELEHVCEALADRGARTLN